MRIRIRSTALLITELRRQIRAKRKVGDLCEVQTVVGKLWRDEILGNLDAVVKVAHLVTRTCWHKHRVPCITQHYQPSVICWAVQGSGPGPEFF
jgi:hypothetical protein